MSSGKDAPSAGNTVIAEIKIPALLSVKPTQHMLFMMGSFFSLP